MNQLQRLCRICDKRFTTEQVKVLFRGHCQGMLGRAEVEQMLGISTRADQCLWEAVRTGRVQVLERDLDRRRERAAQKIEQQAFGSDPNHDLLRALRVGDRRPLSLSP